MGRRYRISLFVDVEEDENGLTSYDVIPDPELTQIVKQNKRALEKIIGADVENFIRAESEEILE